MQITWSEAAGDVDWLSSDAALHSRLSAFQGCTKPRRRSEGVAKREFLCGKFLRSARHTSSLSGLSSDVCSSDLSRGSRFSFGGESTLSLKDGFFERGPRGIRG